MVEQQQMEQPAADAAGGEIERIEGDWKVVGLRKSGSVVCDGKYPFTCRYAAIEGLDLDDLGQDMAVHDAPRERVFTDFHWRKQEPPPKAMSELIARLQTVVHNAVRGR